MNNILCKILLLSMVFLVFAKNLLAIPLRPDNHAPIGVMRDHVHKKNEFMLSYRYSNMVMNGLVNNKKDISDQEIFKKYMNSPQNMNMKMNMLSMMYGLTNKLTISAMLSYVDKDMKMTKKIPLSNINKSSDGIADSKLNLLYQFLSNNNKTAQFNFGLNLPIGKINNSSDGKILAYSMQNGSATFDILPGVSVTNFLDHWSYGMQINSVIRMGKNYRGYRLGNQYNLTIWGAKKLTNNLSLSARLNGDIISKINHKDHDMNTNMTPGMNSEISGRKQIESLIGLNYLFTTGKLKGNRIALEYGVPIYQRINGPALKNDYKYIMGWQKSF